MSVRENKLPYNVSVKENKLPYNVSALATQLSWPQDQWSVFLRFHLTGRAAVTLSTIASETDYQVLKQALLDAYLLSTETYRRKFRDYLKASATTYLEFANNKKRYFIKWLEAAKVSTFTDLVNLILVEELLRRVPNPILLYLADKEESDLTRCAQLADSYSLIHRVPSDAPSSKSTWSSPTKAETQSDSIPGVFVENQLLYRKYKPSKLKEDDDWARVNQLVVPSSQRPDILHLAHGSLSHYDFNKTYHAFRQDYYLPGMDQFWQHLHITVLCPTTRFPIAVPIKNITAATLVKQLLTIFTLYRFPKEIQSDCGTNFTSDLFKKTLEEFHITQVLSSPYHPASQGSLERSHQTIKLLLLKFCIEREKDWDNQLDLIMCIFISFSNESLGVSPYEMLYGRKCRTPVKALKDSLRSKTFSDSLHVPQFLQNVRHTLERVHKFASSNLIRSQTNMNIYFDKHNKIRKFSVGDFVLAYFPIPGSPFQSKFSGPYRIKECRNNYNYVLETTDRRRRKTQLCHINLLKQYQGTPSTVLVSLSTFKDPYLHSETFPASPPECPDSESVPSNSEILKDLPWYFQEPHSAPLVKVFNQHLELFNDNLQECTVVQHDIKLLPGTTPICQSFYCIGQQKKEAMLAVKYGTSLIMGWQHLTAVNIVIQGLDNIYAYFDDIVVVTTSWDDHLLQLQRLFKKLLKAGLTINLGKSTFFKGKVRYLGHVIGSGSLAPLTVHQQAIQHYPRPTTRKQLMPFLGLASYYRRFVKNFSTVATLLINLTSPKQRYHWTTSQGVAFEQVKSLLCTNPNLASPDVTKPFVFNVDASSTGIGGVLMQQRGKEVLPVSYYSQKLKPHRRNYSTIEKELLAILLSIQHYEPYLQGYRSLTIYSDHNSLRFLQQAQFSNKRLLFWALYL
ncbi:uncharacterized protein [Procambarus clarkii]|uniref:uncharacterized protein n=1 Tax=Procambarus clarkii TaxID=6728 RepID=UPI003743F3B6